MELLHVSGSLSAHHQEFLAVHRLWYILCSCDDRLLPEPKYQYQSRCTAKNSWWCAERLPETCRVVIPIKLELSASVGFIHKESVTMHGHTIVKKKTSWNVSLERRPRQSSRTTCLLPPTRVAFHPAPGPNGDTTHSKTPGYQFGFYQAISNTLKMEKESVLETLEDLHTLTQVLPENILLTS